MKARLVSYYLLFILSIGSVIIILSFNQTNAIVLALLGVSVLALMLTIHTWRNFIQKALFKSKSILDDESLMPKAWDVAPLDEFENAQNQIADKIKSSAELISNLADPEKLSSIDQLDSKDPITVALKTIKSEMQRIREADENRQWLNRGLARFSEILRNKLEKKKFTNHILSSLVKYVDAVQGGLYIEDKTKEGERYLELTASYAFGLEKMNNSKIYKDDGMVGQCMIDKKMMITSNLPKNYSKIESALGAATPSSIIVAPLIFNENFCGVIELSFLKTPQPRQIEFLEKVCEDIAAEIISLKNNEHTTELLQESNDLTIELQSREEEMKQNLEKLAATQEEMSLKQNELSGIINAIDSTLATVELDAEGRIVNHNEIFQDFSGYTLHQLREKNYTILTGDQVNWNDILNNVIKSGDFQVKSNFGEDIWFSITFTPINDTEGNVNRILCMVQDITQRKNKEKEFERLSLVADNTDNSVIITSKEGFIEYVNQGFTSMTGYSPQEVIGKKPGSLLQGPLTNKKTIEKLRKYFNEGKPIYEEILNYNKNQESYWVSLAINPVRSEKGEVDKFISIQANITETKNKELDSRQKLEALSRSNAIIELNREGLIIEINENYLNLLGYKREEVVGQHYTLLSGKPNTFDKVMATIAEHGLQSGAYHRYDKKGNMHCMKLMDYPVLNLNGELVKIIEFGVDVSNEKRLEKEAERKQAELNGYLSGVNNTIASVEFELNGLFKEGNEIFLKVMGYQKEELEGKSFDDLMGDEPTVILMWENLRLGKFFSGEFKMVDKQGRELWLSGTFNPVTIEGDVPEKIIMLAQFTTQEKEKLNDLTAMVHALKATLPVLEFNPDFTCKTANEKAMKYFGLSRMGLKSKSIFDLIDAHYHEKWLSKKDELLNSDFSIIQLPFISANSVSNYDVTVSVVRNLNGSVAKIIMLLQKEANHSIQVLASYQ